MIDSAWGTLDRVAAFRLSPGEDLLLGIRSVCEKYDIRHGVILSGIGSLQGARFCDPAAQAGTKAGYGYGAPVALSGPVELISASGCVCEGEDGGVLLHVHCCFADEHGRAFAGHLIEGNAVLLTADLVVGSFSGISMDRRLDPDLGVFIVRPHQK